MRFIWRVLFIAAACLLTFGPAAYCGQAEDQTSSSAQVDVGDLWHHVRHRPEDENAASEPAIRQRFFVVAPTVTSKPSTGITAGLSGNIAFYADDPDSTHISTVVGGARISQKGQALAGVKLAAFTGADRWFLSSDTRLSLTSLNTYPLGATGPLAEGENLKYDFVRVYEAAFRKIHRGIFVGGGLNVSRHSNIRASDGSLDASAYLDYTAAAGFAPSVQTSSGTSVGILVDTRDNPINAERGFMTAATYRTFFAGFLGGSSTWQELSIDARTYRKLAADGRRKIAFWALTDLVTGGTAPYLDLPATGGDNYGRLARGYSEGRYRGERMVYGEVEYRETLTSNGLFGVVGFLNATTIGGAGSSTRLFQSAAPGAGFGFRVLLNKVSRTNLCADYGFGKQGSRGFYLAIQEAF
jgi:hypothetical protein